jgi:hypothetical protein
VVWAYLFTLGRYRFYMKGKRKNDNFYQVDPYLQYCLFDPSAGPVGPAVLPALLDNARLYLHRGVHQG